MAARAKKKILAKRFAHAISVRYRDFQHAYVYWIWLRGSASYVIIIIVTLEFYITYWTTSFTCQLNCRFMEKN